MAEAELTSVTSSLTSACRGYAFSFFSVYVNTNMSSIAFVLDYLGSYSPKSFIHAHTREAGERLGRHNITRTTI